mmetsp:Transcript_9969/g.40937  ORF Transcript_9969/g.40937 Transcript_9969/m.40937 type:complete len:268 (+) Transcript_9969:968-1771(+)
MASVRIALRVMTRYRTLSMEMVLRALDSAGPYSTPGASAVTSAGFGYGGRSITLGISTPTHGSTTAGAGSGTAATGSGVAWGGGGGGGGGGARVRAGPAARGEGHPLLQGRAGGQGSHRGFGRGGGGIRGGGVRRGGVRLRGKLRRRGRLRRRGKFRRRGRLRGRGRAEEGQEAQALEAHPRDGDAREGHHYQQAHQGNGRGRGNQSHELYPAAQEEEGAVQGHAARSGQEGGAGQRAQGAGQEAQEGWRHGRERKAPSSRGGCRPG